MYVGGQKAPSIERAGTSSSEQMSGSSFVIGCGGSTGSDNIGTSAAGVLFGADAKSRRDQRRKVE